MLRKIVSGNSRPQVVVEELVGHLGPVQLGFLVDPRPDLKDFDMEKTMSNIRNGALDRLGEIFEKLHLHNEARQRVLRVVCELIERRRSGQHREVRTLKDDYESVKKVSELSRQLCEAIEGLPDNVKLIFVASCGIYVDGSWSEDFQDKYKNSVGFVAMLDAITGGANLALAAFPSEMPAGGRKPMLDHHGWHVLDIWRAVEDVGLSPGRGSFLELCDAVFDAADIPSGAEGAVKYFMKHLAFVLPQSVEATGRMLDRLQKADFSAKKGSRKNPPEDQG